MKKSGLQKIDSHFKRDLEQTYHRDIHPEIIEKWRKYETTAFDRANEVIIDLSSHVNFQGKNILDVGSGYGGFSLVIASKLPKQVVGLEYDWQRIFLSCSRQKMDHPENPLQFVQASGQDIPFPEGSFDIVICNNVLEHVKDHRLLISEIERVLTPGGWLYISFPNLLSITNFIKDPHYNLFGISMMPPMLARWYVTDFRKVSPTYEVGTFPIASLILNYLKKKNIQVVKWKPAPQRRIGFLTHFLKLFRLNTQGIIIMICKKQG
jgi:ubiquinone/menaquinone biosynthesis C-methylase UbiE